ncbi:MAG: 50S ribosomal protein L5 [Nanoarchaeota archaeon]
MMQPKVDKVVLSAGATGPDLEKARKLLEMITGRKAQIIKAGPQRRIPEFGVKPGLELGTRVSVRGKEAIELLKRLLGAIDNKLKVKQIAPNHFSFGIKEYIEIPGMEYIREIGIRGFNATIAFKRAGVRVKHKKTKSGRIPKRHNITPKEIIQFMENTFKTRFE